jgi:hypothetical protein
MANGGATLWEEGWTAERSTPQGAIRDEPRAENWGGFRSARGQVWLPGLVHARLIGTRLILKLFHLLHETTAFGRATRRASSVPAYLLQGTGWPRHS